MAKAEQIKSLIRSHAEGDDSRFYAVAMQLAAHAARSGHVTFAQELRDLVDAAKEKRALVPSRKPVPLAQPRGALAGLLDVAYPKTRLADMALDERLSAQLHRVLEEQSKQQMLRSHGLSPVRKLLLVGPPGTGKTMTSAALAGELGAPLFTILLDGLITKFMGETAAKLRKVFEAIATTRGVYLFDEFDALGSERGMGNDVGEIRRVLNSFLQFLENDDSDSIVIAATNHVGLLDSALFRRFDAVLEYALPSEDLRVALLRARLALLNTSELDWQAAAEESAGLSHAELARAAEYAAKTSLLAGTTVVETGGIVAALGERRAMRA